MPTEYDDDGREIKREFTIKIYTDTSWAMEGRPFDVLCYRDGQYSGGTPYNKADALACVRRLLADGWLIKMDAVLETLQAILELHKEEP